jgi:asparagine synthase (glutamine-hydrolysing)
VPVGCCLSSGLDSSIVATIAARALPRLTTFTIGFDDVDDPYHGRASEACDARQYAEMLGTEHHTIHVTADTCRENLPAFARAGDQPFGVSSGLGILAMAEAARDAGIKVLLSGDGADECFGGYSWYLHLERLAAGEAALEADGDLSLQSVAGLESALAAMSRYPSHKRAWALHYYASEADKQQLYSRDVVEGSGVRSSLTHFARYKPEPRWDALDYVRQDRAFYFPNEMLRKLDRMTMARSVEGRAPFAAPSVLAHADKLEYPHMIRQGTLKWALRQAFADLLPRPVLERPKHGFNVPIDRWLRSCWADLVEETFAPGSALAGAGLIDRQSRGAAMALMADTSRLSGHTLFCFIMLNLWLTN